MVANAIEETRRQKDQEIEKERQAAQKATQKAARENVEMLNDFLTEQFGERLPKHIEEKIFQRANLQW